MARSTHSSTDAAPASATSQQELYGRPEPRDLDEAGIGRDGEVEDEHPDPGRDVDATGHPSTARSGANAQ